MALQSQTMVGLSMRFVVEVDGIGLGGWASCSGLKVNFNLKEVKEGGTNTHAYYLPDHITYEKISLTRAMNKGDSARLAKWLASRIDKDTGGTAKITLLDVHMQEVSSWTLKNVLPFAWEGPGLDAMGSAKVALEKLTLAHEGFL